MTPSLREMLAKKTKQLMEAMRKGPQSMGVNPFGSLGASFPGLLGYPMLGESSVSTSSNAKKIGVLSVDERRAKIEKYL